MAGFISAHINHSTKVIQIKEPASDSFIRKNVNFNNI